MIFFFGFPFLSHFHHVDSVVSFSDTTLRINGVKLEDLLATEDLRSLNYESADHAIRSLSHPFASDLTGWYGRGISTVSSAWPTNPLKLCVNSTALSGSHAHSSLVSILSAVHSSMLSSQVTWPNDIW